jgi:hypothetical protein
MAEMLAMMTVFGLLFGGLRIFKAPATVYLYLGTQAVVICLVQMRFGSVPRGASMVVGSVFLPLWIWTLAAWDSSYVPARFEGSWGDVPLVVFLGSALGYCTGAMAAGVFLVLDLLDGFARRAATRRARMP